MVELNLDLDFKSKLNDYKEAFLNSKKYMLIYLALMFLIFISLMGYDNYSNPKLELLAIIVFTLAGIFCIFYYHNHNSEEELFKTIFVIILIFGILCSLILPICCSADEVEHFVRAELTSRGEIIPEYHEQPFTYEGTKQDGYYLTIQSILDLIERGKETWSSGYDHMDYKNSTVFMTDADTQPINHSLAKYHNAFAQNPFFGYIAPAIGIALAKLLDLNAIYLLWFGRIFNVLLYATLIALAIRKTPILKVPLMVVSLMPMMLLQSSSLSIDALICGLGIYAVAFFFYMYKSPNGKLDYMDVLKFAIVVLLLGLSKVTYFAFILLILFVPLNNFKERKYYLYGIASIVGLVLIFVLWSRYYVNPLILHSSRTLGSLTSPAAIAQIDYLMAHKKLALVSILNYLQLFDNDLSFIRKFNSIFLLFLGSVLFLYPRERFDFKSKFGALFVFLALYIGTYIVFLVAWSPKGLLIPKGVQPRYFFPAFGLVPFIFGINHSKEDTTEMDAYIIMISIAFLAASLFNMIVAFY